MKYKFMDGTIIEGNELAVIDYLKSNEYDFERFDSVSDYLEHVSKNMFRFLKKSIVFDGETDQEKCINFVHALIDAGVIELVNVTE